MMASAEVESLVYEREIDYSKSCRKVLKREKQDRKKRRERKRKKKLSSSL